jgi:hypothetical protein
MLHHHRRPTKADAIANMPHHNHSPAEPDAIATTAAESRLRYSPCHSKYAASLPPLIIWRNRHASDQRLREFIERANVA